jgi:hypothetical protein
MRKQYDSVSEKKSEEYLRKSHMLPETEHGVGH